MPVSTGAGSSNADRNAKRCRHCEESGHRLDSGNLFWRIHLDQDLFDTIIAIYPEWFKDYNVNRAPTMAEGGSGAAPEPSHSSQGLLPLAEVDDSPLHNSMDKNKESLKVKLMLRRPINQLVAQGIMPPLKTPPAFHEQRQKLERAKMGDLLKAKIQQRPDRQELVRQHILEDVGHVDPSLAERQRMLKKARLADSLNDQLSHRPGPLELIKKNILHTEEPIERAVKEGVIPFKATCEGQVTKPQHPNRYITFEEDSQSSEGGQSPLQTQPATSLPEVRTQPDVLEAAAASAGIVTVALTIPTTVVVTSAPPAFQQTVTPVTVISTTTEPPRSQATTMTFADLCNSVVGTPSLSPILAPAPSPMSLGSTTSSLSPLSSISVSSPPTPSPTIAITPRPPPQPSPISSHRTDAPGKDKNRKKSKSKSQPKTRTIKFHEYKGPPNAHKSTPINASPVETSYELLLQQQQLFLQWQLEWQHKYPQIILPASQKPLAVPSDGSSNQAALSGLIAVTSPAPSQHSVASPTTPVVTQPATPQQATVSTTQDATVPILRALSKLEDMKVSDLKAELKRRNLPVSGSKPQLIERLKSYSDVPQQHDSQTTTIPLSHILMDAPGSVMSDESLSGLSMETPVSPPVVEGSITEDDLSPCSPVSQSLSPEGLGDVDMDTSEGNLSPPPPPSPISEDIIRDQQRKIEELQRELLRSQLQLQKIRNKEQCTTLQQQQRPANGIVINSDLAPKQHQKLILQQHLQQKKQQQQLQLQLQQLQQQQMQQQRQQQHVAFQQQQQQQQQGLNAKASLAAFLQNQSQQQQLANNKNSNNCTAANNKKNIQTAIVLNLQKQKAATGHQRTASLPNFFGSFVSHEQVSAAPMPVPQEEQKPSAVPQPRTTKPPPQYEEATKQLKVKQETPSDCSAKTKKSVKSQIVDDVLEILIKNGELPASAAQDPATPTTPGRSLVFNPPPPPPPLPHTTFAITLPTSITLTSQPPNAETPFHMQFAGPDPLDFLLDNQQAPPGIDLKELGLDLETLDSMDFGQLDCSDLCVPVIKMEPSVTEMETGDTAGLTLKTEDIPLHDQLINQQPCELMDIGEMPMDMDDAEWLESLMPSEQTANGSVETPPHQAGFSIPNSTSSTYHFNHNNVDLDSYDPLLSNSQDPFDLFNIEDPEFKMTGDLNTALGWDKVDFAT